MTASPKLSFIALRCQPASRADRMSAGQGIGLALPTHRRRSQNSIDGGKADCRREAVRPCAHLPAGLKRLQQNLLDVSWNSDTSDDDRPDLDWRCSHQSRREIDNL